MADDNPELADTFGEEFVQEFQQERRKRMAERQKVSEETRLEIADRAVNQGEMQGGNPRFSHTTDSGVTHDVLLVTVPDPPGRTYWSYKTEGDEGSISLPLDYMGEWIWSWFNDAEMAERLVPGENFIVIGNMSVWERDDGTENDQFSPVRGILSIEQVNDLADKALESEGIESDDMESPMVSDSGGEAEAETSTSSSGGGGVSALMEEDEEEEDDSSSFLGSDEGEDEEEVEVDYADVEQEVETLAEKDERVWELTEDDEARLAKMVNVVAGRLGYETTAEGEVVNDDVEAQIRSHIITRIVREREMAEEEDEEDEEEEEESLF